MQHTHIPDVDTQLKLLTRGVVDLNTREAFAARLTVSHAKQEPLIIKAGFDPTAPDLHLGHTVLMEKMAQFQRLGHQVVFIVGDYTSLIGDPTGRNTLRPPLTQAEIEAHAATYTEQCFKILDREKTRVEWNSTWLGKLHFNDLVVLASKYNLGRMLERRDFKERFEKNKQIAMHELLYPLIQGYDSVALKADVELGGHDQIFNLNVGRQLMGDYGLRPQIAFTVPLLVGLDGVDKMSKSKGNHIGITESPEIIFGKTMSVSDETLWTWIPLLTGCAVDASSKEAPLIAKKKLAFELVERFCGRPEAEATAAWWEAGRPPPEQERRQVSSAPLFKLLQELGAASSGGEAKRKVTQGGVSLDDVRYGDPLFVPQSGDYLLKVGKKWSMRVHVV